MAKINWKLVKERAIPKAQEFRRRVGSAPSLRALYYSLVSTDDLPNTKNAYKGLSRYLTKERYAGRFDWNLIKDDSRRTLGNDHGSSLDSMENRAADAAERELNGIINAFDISTSPWGFDPSKWERQPKHVFLAVEKDALGDALEAMTRHWSVKTTVLRGYPSSTTMKKIADRLYWVRDKDVHILLVTDFDPTGEDIVRNFEAVLNEHFGYYPTVTKVAVTMEQIQQFNLPNTPETAEERAKMARDPRFGDWDHGFFRVEVDALLAIVPDDFKRILSDAIAELHDEDIWIDVEADAQTLEDEAKEKLEALKEKIDELKEEMVGRLEGVREDLGLDY